VKIIIEQNGNHAAEREFTVNEAHVRYWCMQKEDLCKMKFNVRAFPGPQNQKIS
jgi:hypothetical protein